jgi:hypothetical protein
MANSGTFKKGDGRTRKPKGTPNKLTTAAKTAIELAAEGLGGATRLQVWAQSDPANERAFWTLIYPKLLPLQVTGEDGKPLVPQALTFVFRQAPDSENRT